MASFKTINLDLPARNEDLSNLEIGSVAYLSGRIFTAREGVYQRAIEDGAGMPASRDALGLANFHCSPAAAVNPDGSYTVGAVTATASFRFAKWLDALFALVFLLVAYVGLSAIFNGVNVTIDQLLHIKR